jgi:hypothetical protein
VCLRVHSRFVEVHWWLSSYFSTEDGTGCWGSGERRVPGQSYGGQATNRREEGVPFIRVPSRPFVVQAARAAFCSTCFRIGFRYSSRFRLPSSTSLRPSATTNSKSVIPKRSVRCARVNMKQCGHKLNGFSADVAWRPYRGMSGYPRLISAA